MTKPRVVVDCNIYLSALISAEGVAEKILRSAEKNLIDIFVSRYIIAEIRDVLARPEFIKKFPRFTPVTWKVFLNRIRKLSNYIRSVESYFVLERDKKDSHYIDLAVYVNADYIVTKDRDLLDLMIGTEIENKQFRQRFRKLKILKPDDLLDLISERGLSLEP